jgi:FkbM family methyltransferase
MSYIRPHRGQVQGLTGIYLDTFGYITDGHFVDVGAFDCYQWSNTFTLASAGWKGIFVEPQPDLADRCRHRLDGMDHVEVVEMAISDRVCEIPLRLAGSLSSIDSDHVDVYSMSDEFAFFFSGDPEYMLVQTTTLDRLLGDRKWPRGFEVLSIDVEGHEMSVLNEFSIHWWRPHLVIVEVHEQHREEAMSSRAVEINQYFEVAGYEKIYSDHINNIYRRLPDGEFERQPV